MIYTRIAPPGTIRFIEFLDNIFHFIQLWIWLILTITS